MLTLNELINLKSKALLNGDYKQYNMYRKMIEVRKRGTKKWNVSIIEF